MGHPTIPKGGDVEKTAAKHYARFGRFNDAYLRMLDGAKVPSHVYVQADKLKQSRFWVMSDEPVTVTERPTSPTIEEVDKAIENLRALAIHAQKTFGPTIGPEAIKLMRWIDYLNENAKHSSLPPEST